MRLSILTKLSLFLPLISLGAEEFSVYHPKFLSTEELVSLADSTFGGKANFSSIGGKVVINASPKTTESVLKLFAEVDTRRRQLKLSFRLVSRAEEKKNSIGFKDGQVIVSKNPSANATLSVEGRQSAEQTETLQSAELLEGTEASMAVGSYWAPGGFVAKARSGAEGSVNLQFRQREPEANPALSLNSEVRVRLGEWKSVGAVNQSHASAQQGILSQGSGQSAGAKDLQVMVELAK